ncbi:MAG: hypothetical protein MUC97_05035 [Bernardetiaceae bacterium]|nr:hypothetical protein [Bernardetiaceae bacterium]
MYITDNAQSSGADSPADYQTKTATDEAGYTYEYVTNDPLQARVYRLPNGLTVYLSQYRASPRIQSYITVKAGGKFDPASRCSIASSACLSITAPSPTRSSAKRTTKKSTKCRARRPSWPWPTSTTNCVPCWVPKG